THFRDVSIALTEEHFAPPSKPIGVSPETAVTTSLFLEAPPGWDDTSHATPRRQWAILLSGLLKVTCGDGDSVIMKPGDAVLLNDPSGKGHLSEVQGDEPARFFLVGLAD
ncbi:MAG: cupin domain-containing protein, partial [Alphaproteobacteria bacterium]